MSPFALALVFIAANIVVFGATGIWLLWRLIRSAFSRHDRS